MSIDPETPNPYAPPVDAPAPSRAPVAANPHRPTRLPYILGIVSLAMAGITLAGSLFSGAIGYGADRSTAFRDLTTRALPAKLKEAYERHYRTVAPVAIFQAVAYGALAVALFVVGIGQLRYRKWARPATLAWCMLAFGLLVVAVYVNWTIVVPSNAYLRQQTLEQLPSGSMLVSMQSMLGAVQGRAFTAAVQVVSHLPYPLVLFIVFTRPRVVRAMTR